VAGWVAYAVYAATATGHSLDGRVEQLQRQNAELHRSIEQRQRQIAAAQDPSWLEEEARRLGYVRPGERVFVLTTPGATLPPEGGIDLDKLPAFSPTPSPGATPAPPTPTPAPPGGSNASPTPFVLNVGTPSPSPR
jgi:hypothetical protein